MTGWSSPDSLSQQEEQKAEEPAAAAGRSRGTCQEGQGEPREEEEGCLGPRERDKWDRRSSCPRWRGTPSGSRGRTPARQGKVMEREDGQW